jgi:hypothetical protein
MVLSTASRGVTAIGEHCNLALIPIVAIETTCVLAICAIEQDQMPRGAHMPVVGTTGTGRQGRE